jgi:hypothetical protein
MLLRCFEIRSVELTKLLGLVRGPPEDSEAAIVRGASGGLKDWICLGASFCTRKIADAQMLATEF